MLAPLAVGVAVRSVRTSGTWLARHDDERDGIAALTVIVLVYASLSGTQGSHGLGSALIASICFCAGSALLGWAWYARASRDPATAIPGALTIAMRDFAVAAALASQAFGTRAAVVPGVYGVVMLVAGTAFVTVVRRR